MAFIRRYRSFLIAILIVNLLQLGFNTARYFWFGGRVVASVAYGSLRIREIPMRFLNDGYAYRCEIWEGDVLMRAETFQWDSYKAWKTSIEMTDYGVVFHIDDRKITCVRVPGELGSQWKGGTF